MNLEDARKTYQQLIQKVEILAQNQLQRYLDEIQCALGCDACCRPPDSLFRIEALYLIEGIRKVRSQYASLIASQLAEYRAQRREFCPLLYEGRCLVYEERPMICRSHGLAIWIAEERTLSWCPLNFQRVQPDREDALDIEILNKTLSVLTTLTFPEQEARRPLVDIIEEALNDV